MKIFVFKTSDWSGAGRVLEFDSLDDCINKLEEEGFPQFVVYRPQSWQTDIPNDVKRIVEIYDSYRE